MEFPEIWGSHGIEFEVHGFLECDSVSLLQVEDTNLGNRLPWNIDT
jgi:hypothetical protein